MNAENNKSERIQQLSRLQWACRRGMLELDVLLGNFLNEHYQKLEDDDKWLFVQLLDHPDPDLSVWLMGGEKPEDAGLLRIIELIKQHAKSRF